MKLSMHKNSLFAVLLRSPWWVSALVALAFGALVRLIVPEVYAAFAALPFVVIAAYSAWQQLRRPGAARIARSLEHLRSLSWEDFSRTLEDAYRREGYTVKRLGAPQADFELVQGSRTTLVACKRWKATRTGIEPLRELDSARRAREAHECFYVAAGEVTETARAFAAQQNIRLVQGPELATLLG
jgi:restriction system protein